MAEIGLRDIIEVRDRCLCLGARRAARALARRFDALFRPLGLTNAQFSLLCALARPEPWRMAPLADFLGLDRTTLTAALKVLARRGLVARSADPDDARARLARITPEGRALLCGAVALWREEHARLDAETPDPAGIRALLDGLAGK